MNYLIWSNEHNSWWMPNSSGYTQKAQYAGRYTLEEAIKICNGANYTWDADTVRAIPMELPVQEEAAMLLEYKAGGERYSLFKSAGSTNGGELIRLKKRMAEAVRLLEDMIDGGEELRGHDQGISEVIRKLEGGA